MAKDTYFPLFFSMEDKRILIIGGGQVAERRIGSLLEFGPKMTVVSPGITDGIRKWVEENLVSWHPDRYQEYRECQEYREHQEYRDHPLQHENQVTWRRPDYVLICTNDTELNHRITMEWKEKGVPVNNASCKEDCDFFFPALIQEEGLVFGVSSDGSDHKKVRRICEKIRSILRESKEA